MTRRVLIVLACVLAWAVPASAAISRIGSCAAQTTSCTFSTAPTSGDAIVVFAHKDGAASAPTMPAAYESIESHTGTSNGANLGIRISDGTETTTGTWTGATSIAAVIYRGANVAPLGNFATGGAVSSTIAYNTFTLNVTTGSSWVVGFAAHRTATNVGQAPTNMTLVTSATDIAVSDTNAGVTSWSTQSVTVNASSGWLSDTIELLAQTGEDTTKLYVDDYINMNTADANGTLLCTSGNCTPFSNGIQGPDTTVSSVPATTTGFTVDAHVINAPATIHKRSPSTDYAVGSTTRSMRYNNTVANTNVEIDNLKTTRFRGGVSIGGYVLFAPPAGVSLYDYWRVDTVNGAVCIMQLDNSGYGVQIESTAGGTKHSSLITLTSGTRYWVTLRCNYQAALAQLAVYTTAGVQVGSTVSVALDYSVTELGADGAYIDAIKWGNLEAGVDGGTSQFEQMIIDYSAAVFPLGPAVTGGSCARTLLGVGC